MFCANTAFNCVAVVWPMRIVTSLKRYVNQPLRAPTAMSVMRCGTFWNTAIGTSRWIRWYVPAPQGW